MKQDIRSPRSLSRILGAFEVIAKSRGVMTLTELSAALDSPKSSLLLLLRPLVARGYLARDGRGYRLGPSIFRLASSILSAHDLTRLMWPHLKDLAEKTMESVCLVRLDRDKKAVTYVDGIDSPQAVRFTMKTGLVRPLYCSAAGRLMLAYQDAQWREKYLGTVRIRAWTPMTKTDPDEVRRELAKIRKSGVSISIGEIVPGSAAIAAPIHDMDGNVTSALLVGAPIDRFKRRLPELERIIRSVAARASGELAITK